jgi:hypothetical protein
VGLTQAEGLFKEIAEGPIKGVFMALGFYPAYVEKSSLPPEAKEEARASLHRFAKAVADGKVPAERFGYVERIVMDVETRADGTKKHTLRKSLRPEEITQCLDYMKKEADAAGVDAKDVKLDLGAVIQGAIDKGLARSRQK